MNTIGNLTKLVPNQTYYELIIVADINDADYLTTIQKFSENQILQALPEMKNIAQNYSESHQLTHYNDEVEVFLPSDDSGCQCHSLIKIELTKYHTDGFRYKVNLLT